MLDVIGYIFVPKSKVIIYQFKNIRKCTPANPIQLHEWEPTLYELTNILLKLCSRADRINNVLSYLLIKINMHKKERNWALFVSKGKKCS